MLARAFEWIARRETPYDWVIACDDETLRSMSEMAWPAGREPAHFPLRVMGISHIYSKIGLSRVLAAEGLRTPPFRVAPGCVEAIAAANELGYPVYLKMDSSNGGKGVFLCHCEEDVRQLAECFNLGPMLVQKKIDGQELDLSAVYLNGELVHFAHASILRALPSSGLSILRRYSPLAMVEANVVSELQALGRALQTDGFVNIACMEAADGSGRYYFEADIRPNAWVDFSRFYGEDAATRIREWFATGTTLKKDTNAKLETCTPMVISYFMRMALWELMVNRYGVWRFIPWADRRVVLSLLWSRMVMPGTRTFVPKPIRHAVKRGMLALRIAFP